MCCAPVRPKAAGLSAESGEFWPDGKHYAGADSFPSGHSAMAFAFAHVVASEYPNWKTKLLVYSLAAATAVERVGGREHFPSDVLVGSAIGYLVGGYVYNHQAASSRNNILLSPIVGNKAVGVSLAFSF
jgi:membrane-associated phospholipid phosphatase